MTPATRAFLAAFVVSVVVDQATKLAILATLAESGGELPVIPGLFALTHAENPAAAFGMLASAPGRRWVFLAFALFALAVGLVAVPRLPPSERLVGASLGLLIGGAVGNGIDRAWKGSVTDFLKVHVESGGVHDALVARFGTSEWPTFNVADTVLWVGIALFLLRLAQPDGDDDGPDREAA
jgi:signal peptidase II